MTELNLRLPDFRNAKYRFNQVYQLVAHKDLPLHQQQLFQEVAQKKNHFGLLIPFALPLLGTVVIDKDIAAVIKAILTKGELPEAVKSMDNEFLLRHIGGLILDGVLEIERNGKFLTGPDAASLIFEAPAIDIQPSNEIAKISITALQLSENLLCTDVKKLASWLYHFHRLPMNTKWAQQYFRPEHIEELLGLNRKGPVQKILTDHYQMHDLSYWKLWQAKGSSLQRDNHLPDYKLYIGLHPQSLFSIFPLIIGKLIKHKLDRFKMAKTAFGLLRADKMIVYSNNFQSLQILAEELRPAITGCTPQVVPFTAPLVESGIFSWGLDPPKNEKIPGWIEVESWRSWLTSQLARSILRAKSLGHKEMAPWQFALFRLQLKGLQVENWTPNENIWN